MYIEVRSFCKKKQSARRKVQPKSTFCYIWFLHTLIYQRKFSSKFSELGTNVQGHSFHPAITIMSSWQHTFCHRLWEQDFGNAYSHGCFNTLGCETLCFSDNVAPSVAEVYRVSVSTSAGLIVDKKCTGL